LVVDDDPNTILLLCTVFGESAIEVRGVSNTAHGANVASVFCPQLVILDRRAIRGDSGQLMAQIASLHPSIDVILTDVAYSTDSAVEAIQQGAFDCWPKPLKPDFIRRKIANWLDDSFSQASSDNADDEAVELFRYEGMVGRSPAMLEVFSKLRRIAPHYRTALLTGETGTGKDLAARVLHRMSPVAAGPLVACNCAAIVDNLFESELFGHVKGAFTGADQNKQGFFDRANEGTIFLDEIGELSLSQQSKLLRVLQNSEIRPVGSGKAHHVNVRVVAATNRNLRHMVAEKSFREDLYYRLAMVQVRMPSLVERREDIPLLKRHFLRVFETKYSKLSLTLSRRAQALLMRYTWPGNIRELENVLGYCAMMAESEVIDLPHFPPEMLAQAVGLGGTDDSMLTVDELVRRHTSKVLQRVNGNRSRAAEILGISRATIYRLLRPNDLPEGPAKESPVASAVCA
jgi:DNA-binding NtrC family response regulator